MQKASNDKGVRPVFVVSTGRTGTTFLAEAIHHLGWSAAHEPGPRWLRLASNAYVGGTLSHKRAKAILQRTRPIERQWSVEASCLIYGLVAPILDVFPEARVVQLVRDPRTYVSSAVNWGVHRATGRVLNIVPYRRLAPSHLEGRHPQALLSWAKSDQFARVCWTWRRMNEAIQAQGEGHPRFRRIRMEDLFDPEREFSGFRQILDLAGIADPGQQRLKEMSSRRVNASRIRRIPPWEQWSTESLEHLVQECGHLASQYGYPLDEEVAAVLKRRSIG